jgi:hypothetical protein
MVRTVAEGKVVWPRLAGGGHSREQAMDRAQAELARGVERYIFRRVAADPSPLLDDHTREIIAEAIAWAVTRALGVQSSGPADQSADVRSPLYLRVGASR